MARLTIGIPVYNGEAFIEECLTNITNQSYREFKLIISDNASVDQTSEICKRFATADNRIEYFKQPQNLGPLKNFKFLLHECDTEFFMWRADDDYSDIDYIATLINLLDQNPKAQLAVPQVKTIHGLDKQVPWFKFENIKIKSRIDRIISRFYSYHASWYYGIWRSQYIFEISDRVWRNYPHAYAADHLTMLSPIFDEAIVGTNDASFVQRTYSPVKGDGLRGKIPLSVRIERLQELLPLFNAAYEKEVISRDFSNLERKILTRERRKFTFHKLRASRFRIFRLKVKNLFKLMFDQVR